MHGLIIGYGSIGKRHALGLSHLDCEISLVTAQNIHEYPCYSSVSKALACNKIDFVIIANQTHLHHQVLLALIQCGYDGNVIVEKPLFSQCELLPMHAFRHIRVAYNLRFHDLLIETKALLKNEQLVTFSVYVGQYLPSWRPGTDYRVCYSAGKTEGGGVLRDLSHELDYIQWLCGPCHEVVALGGHLSTLDISSDDAYSIIMKNAFCPLVSLQVNYLDRSPKREIVINTQSKTITLDLIKGTLAINGVIVIEQADLGVKTYSQQHIAIVNSQFEHFCSYDEGISVMQLIAAIEKSTVSRQWISL